MDSINASHFTSPKRKRGIPSISTIPPTPPTSSPPPEMRLNTNIPGVVRTEEDSGQGSPRTKVAYNFQGLHLEDGGAVGRFELDGPRKSSLLPRDEYDEEDPHREEEVLRKRVKVLKQRKITTMEIPETPQVNTERENKFSIFIGPERTVDPIIGEKARAVVLSNEVDPMIFRGSPVAKSKTSGLGNAYPSINRLADSKSRAPKKRTGTPPLSGSADAIMEGVEPGRIVDPDRAALTWHDDEITGHDPNDPDDDGEGINGIGFRPTAAEAYARAQKRRQQMAEYKNREAREARKARSERRRGSGMENKATREEAETARRVRFMEAEVKSVRTISTS
ncbi:uncharacterized protein LY89DRAFT_689415 [Mollisia scopiformis]|uniref:Uncharacterized protein n=1 Tax=Mollisia scopiformis TaxID=149040 RepID=A0A194WS62_MOLSC|nr:uncharacterized protein LY89DRAFT_689415 [Mollisia scopiformis]KUJ10811.1 hypothetical protein LY89DRAFT_689415 [Mollisia scopiformis]